MNLFLKVIVSAALLWIVGCIFDDNGDGEKINHRDSITVSDITDSMDYKDTMDFTGMTDSLPSNIYSKLFVVGSDYQSGILKSITLDSQKLTNISLDIFQDSRLLGYGKALYILERIGADNIINYNPQKSGTDAVVYQKHLISNSNPQDIAFVDSSKAYISLENEPLILIINPATGDSIGSINTSKYIFQPAQDSGVAAKTPHAANMIIQNNKLYVALQRRNGDWQKSGGAGVLLVINIKNDSILGTLKLAYKNISDMATVNHSIYVSTSGSYSSYMDGAIEKIDLSNNKKSVVITADKLGGDPEKIAHKTGDLFYVSVYKGWQDVGVKLVNFSTGEIVANLPGIVDAYGGILYEPSTKRLFVGERDATASGVKVFNDSNQLIAGPVSVGLPPYSFVASFY